MKAVDKHVIKYRLIMTIACQRVPDVHAYQCDARVLCQKSTPTVMVMQQLWWCWFGTRRGEPATFSLIDSSNVSASDQRFSAWSKCPRREITRRKRKDLQPPPIGPLCPLKCVFSVAFPLGATLVGGCPHQPDYAMKRTEAFDSN